MNKKMKINQRFLLFWIKKRKLTSKKNIILKESYQKETNYFPKKTTKDNFSVFNSWMNKKIKRKTVLRSKSSKFGLLNKAIIIKTESN